MKKLFITLFLLAATQADAQSWLDKVGKKVENSAKRTIERKAEQKTEQAVGKAVDKATDKGTYQGSEKDKDVETMEWTEMEPGEIEKSAGGKQGGAPKLEAYSKYDFVPGDQILFYEDFSQDAIGDFPALWTTNASGEVKTLSIAPGKWLQNTTRGGEFTYLNKLDLPANFILEFDYIPYFSKEAQQKNPNRSNWYATGMVKMYSDKPGKEKEFDGGLFPGDMGLRIHFRRDSWSMDAYDYSTEYRSLDATSDRNCVVSEQVNHIIVWVQNRRVRVYHGGAKIMDIPTMLAPDTKLTRLRLKVTPKKLLNAAMLAVALLGTGKAGAQPEVIRSPQLPEVFRQLVPQSAVIDVAETTKTPEYGTGTVTFAASRAGKDGRFETSYLFELTIVTARTIESAEKWHTMYRKDLESKAGSKMKEENSTINCENDPPELTGYPWGSGVRQRSVCKDTDRDNTRNEMYYDGTYYGLIEEDGGVFKLFTLTVKYGENPEETDEWAKKAVQLISETTLDQL